MNEARVKGERYLCWRWQCGGVLATGRGIDIPDHFVKSEDADGVLYEEPPARRRRRAGRGLSSVRHRPQTDPMRPDSLQHRVRGAEFVKSRSFRLPVRIRCPECGWVSLLTWNAVRIMILATE